MLKGIGLPELVIVLVIVLLVFGAGKLPDIGRALGKTMSEFRKAKDEGADKGAAKVQPAAEKPLQPGAK